MNSKLLRILQLLILALTPAQHATQVALPALLLQGQLCQMEFEERLSCDSTALLSAARAYGSAAASEVQSMQEFDGSISRTYKRRLQDFVAAVQKAFHREIPLLSKSLNQSSLGMTIQGLESVIREVRRQGYSDRSLRPLFAELGRGFEAMVPKPVLGNDYRSEDVWRLQKALSLLKRLQTAPATKTDRMVLSARDARQILRLLDEGRSTEARTFILNALRGD